MTMIRAELYETLGGRSHFVVCAKLPGELPDRDVYPPGTGYAGGRTPVLSLCRKLVRAGVDPAEPMTVYRGKMVALRVRSIGEAAGLTVLENERVGPRFAKYRPGSRVE